MYAPIKRPWSVWARERWGRYLCLYINICIYIYTHIYIHIYIYICIHTYAYIHILSGRIFETTYTHPHPTGVQFTIINYYYIIYIYCIYIYICILIYHSKLHTCKMGASIGSLKYPPTSFVIILLQELRNIWSILYF